MKKKCKYLNFSQLTWIQKLRTKCTKWVLSWTKKLEIGLRNKMEHIKIKQSAWGVKMEYKRILECVRRKEYCTNLDKKPKGADHRGISLPNYPSMYASPKLSWPSMNAWSSLAPQPCFFRNLSFWSFWNLNFKYVASSVKDSLITFSLNDMVFNLNY